MYLVSHKATERGIALRNVETVNQERQQRAQARRSAYEAELAESARIEAIRSEAAERARAYAKELHAAGYRYRPAFSDIERKACDVFGVTRKELHSRRRHRSIVFAKQFVMYWAVRLTPLSLPQIGRLLGGLDHTSVLHGKNVYPEKRALQGRTLRAAR